MTRLFASGCQVGSWCGLSLVWGYSARIVIARFFAGCKVFVQAAFLGARRCARRASACLLGKPETPGAFYRGMRTMAVDGFVLDQMLADGSFLSKMYRCDSDRRHDRNAIMTRSSLGKNSS